MDFSAPNPVLHNAAAAELLARYRSAQRSYFGFKAMARANPKFNTPEYRAYRVRMGLLMRQVRAQLAQQGIAVPHATRLESPVQRRKRRTLRDTAAH